MIPVLLSLFTVLLGEPAPGFLRLSLEGGPSPFSSVEYQFQDLNGTVVVCSHKEQAPVDRDLVRCGTMSKQRFLRLAGDLKNLQVNPNPDRQGGGAVPRPNPDRHGGGSPAPSGPLSSTWLLEASVPEAGLELAQAGEVLDPKPPFAQAAALVAQEAVEALGAELFKDAFGAESRSGVLSVWTRPRARLFIDGVDYGRLTPVLGIVLPAGPHRVVFVREERGLRRSGTVEVKAGRNTNYFLELEPKALAPVPQP